jgi:hypothetical protein
MGDPTPSAWENQTWNKVGDGRVIVGAAKEDVNSRKRLNFDDSNITDGTLLIIGAEGKVSDMVVCLTTQIVKKGLIQRIHRGKFRPQRGQELMTTNLPLRTVET